MCNKPAVKPALTYPSTRDFESRLARSAVGLAVTGALIASIAPVYGQNAITPPTSAPAATSDAAAATDSTSTSDSGSTVLATAPINTLQQVVVTANRRTQLPVNVPMSIAVLGSTDLKQTEVKSFNDFANQVASLSFNYGAGSAFGGNTDDRAVAIRGIAGQDTTGFYLDDLPLPISMSPRVLDIQRIEVLRGPQGTLYGARSMGGTIRMITTPPDLTQFSADLDEQATAIDGGGRGYEFYGTFNVPIVNNKLAIRLTPFRGQDGGFINRLWPQTPPPPTASYADVPPGPYGEQKNTAENEYYGVDASLLWKPTSNLTIRPRSIYQSTSSNGLPLGNYSASNLSSIFNFNIPEGIVERFSVNGLTVDYETPVGSITNSFDMLHRYTEDYENVSEFTSYAFGTPLLPSPISQFVNTHIVNEELRFVSAWQFPLQLTAGLFYNRQEFVLNYQQPIPQFLPIFGTPIAAANFAGQVAEERALFGELTYHLTPHWSATIGGRYSRDREDFFTYAWGAAFGPSTINQAIPGVTPDSGVTSERDSVFTPRFVLKYEPNGNINIYADAAKGFRPGGGEVAPPVTLCGEQYAALGLTPGELSSFKPDSIWSYELGAKALSANHRFEVNTALYWINWTNLRETLPLSCGFAPFVNSGAARSRGAEVEFSAVPITNLTVSGGIGYDDAKIVSGGTLQAGSSPVWWQIPGAQIPDVAPITGHLGIGYHISLRNEQSLELRTDYSFTDHSYTATTSPFQPYVRPSYSLLDFRLAFTRGNMQFALFMKNALDQHPNYGEQESIAGFVPGRLRWTTGVPRTIGVEASQRF